MNEVGLSLKGIVVVRLVVLPNFNNELFALPRHKKLDLSIASILQFKTVVDFQIHLSSLACPASD